jgi:hypothetical protein
MRKAPAEVGLRDPDEISEMTDEYPIQYLRRRGV